MNTEYKSIADGALSDLFFNHDNTEYNDLTKNEPNEWTGEKAIAALTKDAEGFLNTIKSFLSHHGITAVNDQNPLPTAEELAADFLRRI